jgi:hypothetical protein
VRGVVEAEQPEVVRPGAGEDDVVGEARTRLDVREVRVVASPRRSWRRPCSCPWRRP